MRVLRQFPVFVLILLGAASLMLVPALHAARLGLWPVARAFADHALFFALVGGILGLATMNRAPRRVARYHLVTLFGTYAALPLALAAPLVALVPGLGIGAGYFEMLSCLTTTGSTLFARPQLLPEPIHLWRALVGWSGGLMVLVTAFAVLAPLNLGGFEIGVGGATRREAEQSGSLQDANRRILHAAREIAPVYAGLTALLALLLFLAGDRAFVAVCHAMAVLSTSAVSPVGGLEGARAGRLGEVAMAVFLLPAVSHLGFTLAARRRIPSLRDPQVQLMLITVLGVTALLFLRSFVGAAEIARQDNLAAALKAAWGSVFTLLSFLTTTGFVSQDWRAMQLWSDLPQPSAILLGVAVMGGGIATTAGGVKLLRLYALYRHGLREMDKLVHPSSVGRRGQGDALIARGAARIAFVFLMLTLIALALAMLALAATGLSFERSLTLGVAALTTTGPAIATLGDGLGYADLSGPALAVLCVAMIVGRMEVLVIVALLNPAWWRK